MAGGRRRRCAIAAVQLARLAGTCLFLTALGDDSLGHRAYRELDALGVRVGASWRSEPQRRAFVHVDAGAERTITVLGKRVGPRARRPAPWKGSTAPTPCTSQPATRGDAQAARRARKLVSTVRAIEPLSQASVPLDALVSSATDQVSATWPESSIHPCLRSLCAPAGASGGEVTAANGRTSGWKAAPLPGPKVDSYGAGDSFAAGATYALGEGRSVEDALALAARAGAACMTGRGPYEGQLRTAV